MARIQFLATILSLVFSASLIPYSSATAQDAGGSAASSNPQYTQWKGAGGRRLLSGKHEFTETWVSDSGSRAQGKYWRDNYYLPVDKRKYAPWENTVKNAVSPRKGQITVQGPGVVALYSRQKGARIGLIDVKTKKGFSPKTCAITYSSKIWQGTIPSIDPAHEFWGKIGAGETVCLDVYAVMVAYNNMMNTGEFSYCAPQDVEFEIWYFPLEGGKVIKVKKVDADGKEVDSTDDPDGTITGNTPANVIDAVILPPGFQEPVLSSLVGGNVTDEGEPPVEWQDKYDKLLEGGLEWKIVERIMMKDAVTAADLENRIYSFEGKVLGCCETTLKGVKFVGSWTNYMIGYMADRYPAFALAAMPLDLAYAWAGSRQQRYDENGDLSLVDTDDVVSMALKYGENKLFGKFQDKYINKFSFMDNVTKVTRVFLDANYIDPMIEKSSFEGKKKNQMYVPHDPKYTPGKSYYK